ncbi:MAG: ribosome maturation factor RimP [Acidiferrobacterales bacterium]|jgi:ribosome maturation factor RimP|nr:ribosome maturation factor RimP [Acidiferrobacterales bacterium]
MALDTSALRDVIEPSVSALGYDLVAVELTGDGSSTILRVYIDLPGGITIDDCEAVSRQVSAVLDVEDPIRGEYTLEVSSPGLDRPLVRREDFERYVGEDVKIRMSEQVLGRRNFTGRLQGIEGNLILIEVDNEIYELDLEHIERARLVPKF